MPLNSDTLSADIVSRWMADPKAGFSSPLTAAQQDMVKALADGVAAAVVTHLTSAAVVAVTGVQPGGGAAAGRIT